MHRAEVVRIDGASYRAKGAQEREAERSAQRTANAQKPRSHMESNERRSIIARHSRAGLPEFDPDEPF